MKPTVNIPISLVLLSNFLGLLFELSDLDKMRIEEQKKAVRAGYDMDVLPPDIITYDNGTKSLLEDF